MPYINGVYVSEEQMNTMMDHMGVPASQFSNSPPPSSGGGAPSAEQLATASDGEFSDILETFDIGSQYEKYFPDRTFVKEEVDDIEALFQKGMEQMDLQKENLLTKSSGTASKVQAKAVQDLNVLGGKQRYAVSSRGFEGAGDMSSIFKNQMDAIVGAGETSLRDSMATTRSGLKGIGIDRDIAGLEKDKSIRSAYKKFSDQFYEQLGMVQGLIDANDDDDDGRTWWDDMNLFGGENKGGACVVSTALNTSGAWSDSEKKDAVDWCQETHHDGSERGKAWIKGYHTWGKFLSKWVKKSKIVRWVVDTTTTAFVDHTKRNKPNYLGWMIHYLWINPLSYIIGYSKKNKIVGKIATVGLISVYTLLFPLFALVSIPHVIKEKYGSSI